MCCTFSATSGCVRAVSRSTWAEDQDEENKKKMDVRDHRVESKKENRKDEMKREGRTGWKQEVVAGVGTFVQRARVPFSSSFPPHTILLVFTVIKSSQVESLELTDFLSCKCCFAC